MSEKKMNDNSKGNTDFAIIAFIAACTVAVTICVVNGNKIKKFITSGFNWAKNSIKRVIASQKVKH